jgi:hypothetical protein
MANESPKLITVKVRKSDVERAQTCKKSHGFKSIKDIFGAGVDRIMGEEHPDQLSKNMAMLRVIRQDLHENLAAMRKLLETQSDRKVLNVKIDTLLENLTVSNYPSSQVQKAVSTAVINALRDAETGDNQLLIL